MPGVPVSPFPARWDPPWVVGECWGGLWGLKSLLVSGVSAWAWSVLPVLPYCSQAGVMEEQGSFVFGCWEMNGEGGLVLLSRAGLEEERLESSSGADLKPPAHVQSWVRNRSVYQPGSK